MYIRAGDRDNTTDWATREAQYDPMILPRYSHLLAGLIPPARLT